MRIAFTPDEEIGRGANRFDVARFGAVCAYTLDGGSARRARIRELFRRRDDRDVQGFNTHPGYAKGRMVNAIRLAARFHRAAARRIGSRRRRPTGYEGYVHPYVVDASVDRTSVKVLIRDFVTAGLKEKEAMVETLAREVVAGQSGRGGRDPIEESYRNMREVLDRHPEVVERAREAIRRAGLTPSKRPIRGGTDGSRLSFMGLPTPNLFAGEHNFHSRLEWVSAQDMDKAVEVDRQTVQGVGGGPDNFQFPTPNSQRTLSTIDSEFLGSWELEVGSCFSFLLEREVHRHGHDHRHRTPFRSVGSNCHSLTAVSAAASSIGMRPEHSSLDRIRFVDRGLEDDDALHLRAQGLGRVDRRDVLTLSEV